MNKMEIKKHPIELKKHPIAPAYNVWWKVGDYPDGYDFDGYYYPASEFDALKADRDALVKEIEDYNAKQAKVPTSPRPKTVQDGLRFLAKWFDAFYGDAGTGADVVQHDLRRWACDIDRLIARLDAATDGKWHEDEIEAAKYRASKQACEIGWCDHAKLAETLRCALENIAKQKLSSELLAKDDSEYENADFECGYDEIVKIAREAVKLANL